MHEKWYQFLRSVLFCVHSIQALGVPSLHHQTDKTGERELYQFEIIVRPSRSRFPPSSCKYFHLLLPKRHMYMCSIE